MIAAYDRLIAAMQREQASAPDCIGAALTQAASCPDSTVRELALQLLPRAASSDPAWQEYIRAGMAVRDPLVRRAAAEAAGRLDYPGAVSDLCGLLHDRNELVRVEAIEALWGLGARNVVSAIEAALTTDSSGLVRGYAARALAELAGEAAIPALRRRFAVGKSRWASAQLALALYELGQLDLFPVLVRRLHSRDRLVRISVANNIEVIAQPGNCATLLPALSDALGCETTVSGKEALERALQHVHRICASMQT